MILCAVNEHYEDFPRFAGKISARMCSEGCPCIVWASDGWTLVFASTGSSCCRRVVLACLIPCLCGKLQNLSFSKVSKQVVMSFCVAGVAVCDIPTCLRTCPKCQNWSKSRTTCSVCCAHVLVSSRWFSCGIVRCVQVRCASFLVHGSTGKCFVQAL